MSAKVPTGKVRKSLIMNKDTCEVISATAKIYNCTFSEMLNRIADNFAKQNAAAVSIVAKLQQDALKRFSTVAKYDFDDADGGNSAQ